jgi:hypothetical protein
MRTTYELRSGSRPIALREAWSARDAVFDYVRALGCREDELVPLGPDAVSWRGAVYRAAPVPDETVDAPRPAGTR